MEAIQPVGIGNSSQVTTDINQITMSSTNRTSGIGGATSGVKNINSAISGMLKSIGGGLENDELLKALIALIIIAALLQESIKGFGQGSAESLRALGNGRSDPTQSMSTSSTFTSYESTSVYSTTTITATDAGTANGTDLGGRMDVTG